MRRPGLLLALVAVLVLPGRAEAADRVAGGTAITLSGAGARALAAADVGFVATAPSSVRRATLTLPATTATFGETASATHAGVLQMRRGRGAKARRLTLTGLRTQLGRRASTSALLAGRRVTILTYGRSRPAIDSTAGTVRLTATASLSRPMARAIRSTLRLQRLRSRRLGRAALALARRADVVPVPAPGPAPRRRPARRQRRRRRDDLAAARVVRPLHEQRGRAHRRRRGRDRRAERGAARQRRPARVLVRAAVRERDGRRHDGHRRQRPLLASLRGVPRAARCRIPTAPTSSSSRAATRSIVLSTHDLEARARRRCVGWG